MGEMVLTVLGGACGAALVTGVFTLVQHRLQRRDAKEDRSDVTNKALRYLMLYIIQERAKSHIKEGKITLDDRRSLHHWHSLYHDGLGGNGDADDLMDTVDKLPLDIQE